MKKILLLFAVLGACANAQPLVVPDDIAFTDINGVHYIGTSSEDALIVNAGQGLVLNSEGSVTVNAANGAITVSTVNDSITLNAPDNLVSMTGESVYVGTQHGIQLQPSDTAPTCSAGYRGLIYFQSSDTGVADALLVCMKLANDSYAWVTK